MSGDSNYVRVQVLTPVCVLDRQKQLGVVKELTVIANAARKALGKAYRSGGVARWVSGSRELVDLIREGFAKLRSLVESG